MKRPLTLAMAAAAIARLTRRRLYRGKLLRIAAVLALVPVAMVGLLASQQDAAGDWPELFSVLTVILVVIPALLLAPWMSEELDDRTYTYLWSRPLPRHAVMLGKFQAMVPVALGLCAMTVGASFVIAFGARIGDNATLLVGSLLGIGCGVLAWSAASVGIGSVVPRYATAAVIVYFMFLDSMLGGLPYSIQNLSMAHHVRHIMASVAERQDGAVNSIVWLVAMSVIWLGVAAWRVNVTEYTTED